MKKYHAVYLNREDTFTHGETIEMVFVVYDSNGDLVTDLSGFEFNAHLEDGVDELALENATDFSVSGEKVTLTISDSDTENFSANKFSFELACTVSSKNYTLLRDTIYFKKDELDWD